MISSFTSPTATTPTPVPVIPTPEHIVRELEEKKRGPGEFPEMNYGYMLWAKHGANHAPAPVLEFRFVPVITPKHGFFTRLLRWFSR